MVPAKHTGTRPSSAQRAWKSATHCDHGGFITLRLFPDEVERHGERPCGAAAAVLSLIPTPAPVPHALIFARNVEKNAKETRPSLHPPTAPGTRHTSALFPV